MRDPFLSFPEAAARGAAKSRTAPAEGAGSGGEDLPRNRQRHPRLAQLPLHVLVRQVQTRQELT